MARKDTALHRPKGGAEPIRRVRPLPQYRVLLAVGPYRKGDIIQPVGVYRDALLARKLIEKLPDEPSSDSLFDGPERD